MACYPSPWCPCCGGVCATDETDAAYKPMTHVWAQVPVEIPGPDYLDRFRTVNREEETDE